MAACDGLAQTQADLAGRCKDATRQVGGEGGAYLPACVCVCLCMVDTGGFAHACVCQCMCGCVSACMRVCACV